MSKHYSCGNSCIFGAPGGMATNGPCVCLEDVSQPMRRLIHKEVARLRAALCAADECIETLRESLASAEEELDELFDELTKTREYLNDERATVAELRACIARSRDAKPI